MVYPFTHCHAIQSNTQWPRVVKASRRLEKLWFPYFDDPEEESAFVAVRLCNQNVRYLKTFWILTTLCSVLYLGHQYILWDMSFMYYDGGLSKAGIAVLSTQIVHFLVFQMPIVYYFTRRLCIASDVFLSFVAVAFIVSLVMASWWRIGTAVMGDM